MTPHQFLAIAAVLPEPTLLVRDDGLVMAANPAARLLGVEPADLCGKLLKDLVIDRPESTMNYLSLCSRSRTAVVGALTLHMGPNPGLLCRAQGALVSLRTETEPAYLFLRLTPKDLSTSQFLLLNQKIDNLSKEVKRRKQTEEDLRKQKEWLQVTLNSIGDAVIATSPDGAIMFMNPVAESYLGSAQAQVVGRPLAEVFRIINEETRKPVDNPVSEVIKSGGVVGLANHTILLHRDGTERPIEDSAAPIKDENGRIRGVILVFRDVTQQRLAERELRKADRRKDEFLATLAHELRNPLAPIRHSLEIVKRLVTTDDRTVHDAHEIMDRQLTHMVRLIDDLLDLSRISRGKFELKCQKIELGAVLEQALETCHPLVAASGHILEMELPEEAVYVMADPLRLAQVFTNLLNNACKFTPRNGHIQLTTGFDRDMVTVSIRDNGLGIPEDHISAIFEMFSQVDSSLERSQGGLGIGLTLAKQIIEMHAGKIAAHSSGAGKGSEFIVHLPTVSGSTASISKSSATMPQESRKRRILIVDDNRDSATTLTLLLKLAGHLTRSAFDGVSALTAAEEFAPEIILLDIGLPELNGYDVCREIRKSRWGSGIALIAITGWGQDEDRRKAADAGFDAHLVKPVDLSALKTLIEQI